MHELDPGGNPERTFAGQFRFIEFSTEFRLPRHVHIAPPSTTSDRSEGKQEEQQRFVAERIVVLNGVALVELNGEIYVVPPKSLVTIAPGVPHTWTACPAGVVVPPASMEEAQPNTRAIDSGQRITSTGTFLMLYEYEVPTAFFPTAQRETLMEVGEYVRCDDLDSIRIPKLTADEVNEECHFFWNRDEH